MSAAGHASLIGGALCLDFVNTVGGRRPDVVNDKLTSYVDLAAWSMHTGLISAVEGEALAQAAQTDPEGASRVLARATALREAIYRIFLAQVEGWRVSRADLELLNAALGEALAHARVTQAEGRFQWEWEGEPGALDRAWWDVARSAAELLTSGPLERVNHCNGEECGWLFIDTSKNHSRRWCDMSDCGNRAKAKRHYQRARAGRKGASPERGAAEPERRRRPKGGP